jgi:hypothetical protein
MAQIHDAILLMVPIEEAEAAVSKARSLMEHSVEINGREMVIPTGTDWGFRWDKESLRNTFEEGVKLERPDYEPFNLLELPA